MVVLNYLCQHKLLDESDFTSNGEMNVQSARPGFGESSARYREACR
jgi:hypothetical protein